jgi:hypothetical protein
MGVIGCCVHPRELTIQRFRRLTLAVIRHTIKAILKWRRCCPMITEADTCRKYILPTLTAAGWDAAPQSFSLSSLITLSPKSANAVCSLTMIELSQVTGLPLTQEALKIYEW